MAQADVSSRDISFIRGITRKAETALLTIAADDVVVRVGQPQAGSPFGWKGSPPGDWVVPSSRPQAAPGVTGAAPSTPVPRLGVTITFTPTDDAPVEAKLTVEAFQNTPARQVFHGFPIDVRLRGNQAGVGPGMLNIATVVPNPPGPDLAGEFVDVINVSGGPLDVEGCQIGDGLRLATLRGLLTFPKGVVLQPVTGTATPRVLRVFTGPGAPVPAEVQAIALRRGSPVWNNDGDTAWIRNAAGQMVNTFTYGSTNAFGAPAGAPRLPIVTTATVRVAPTTSFMPTTLTVEDGDRLTMAAFGSVWVGTGIGNGNVNPDGRPGEFADDAPAPDISVHSLIARIGPAGKPFWVGTGGAFIVREQEGTLFLGINDPKPGDNWGDGFTCMITQMR